MMPNTGFLGQHQQLPQQPFLGQQEGQFVDQTRGQVNPMQYQQDSMMNQMEGQSGVPMIPEQHNRPDTMGNYPSFGFRGQQQQQSSYPSQHVSQTVPQYPAFPQGNNAYQNPGQVGQPMMNPNNFQEEMTAAMMSGRNHQNQQQQGLEQPMYE